MTQNFPEIHMKHTYYTFSSEEFLNTIWASPKIFEDELKNRRDDTMEGSDIHMELLYGEYPADLEFPVEFIVQGGSKLRDVIEMRYHPGLVLISDRVKQIFESNGLTGWKPYDVIVRKKSGETLAGFNGLSIIGRLPEGWDSGTVELPDFFKVEPAHVICTSKVVKTLKDNNIKCFKTDAIDKEKCEKIFKFRKEFGKYLHANDKRTVFFEKIYGHLTATEQHTSKE